MGFLHRLVCPVFLAGMLDNRFRHRRQDPRRILAPYVSEGMAVLDIGCGPGFFSVEMARMVGPSGKVIAADLQDGMLQKLRRKIRGTELESRIVLHRCPPDALGVADTVDFALAFYMVHEVPDRAKFFRELATLLKPGGRVLVVEPPFHVSKREFAETIRNAQVAGFEPMAPPQIFFSRTALLKKM